ncbi:helix-turn-helix domain-containing protein [Aliidiomarina maris]|uniref:Regulatory Fis family protein n=1 Tax=Aliidiomarina maris TaxID=531312 RepID=A0A327X6H6_9GAMM|nr:regulatory Fis family protein [Aliidiomarina maris]
MRELQGDNTSAVSMPEQLISVDALEWELIHQTLAAHDNNISATARALNMHRRTLQRKLQKKRPQ